MKHDEREPGLFKEEFRCTEMLSLCSKTYCCYYSRTKKTKFSRTEIVLEEINDEPLQKYGKVLDEALNVSSNNRGFKTVNHQNLTYEESKKGLS